MILIPIILAIIIFYGVYEQRLHKKSIESIPIRVNINGIRGKSTVTRLITGIVREAGYKTIGKTTGTSARMIFWFKDEEEPIIRRPEGPNIGEQRRVVQKAADLGCEALISECMAVNPDYQITFQEKLVQANIGVIVNVLEDHMDVMGPTLDEVAEAFMATIPYNGHLIVTDDAYLDYYKKIAKDRNTKVIVADHSQIKESFLRQFEYMVFPDNAALALGVAEALGIDKETAFNGMLRANPDPGAMRITILGDEDSPSYFVNGFAANDASSTLKIWDRIVELGYPTEKPVVIMNCRADRVDRTEQFSKDVLPYIDAEILILIGETTSPIVNEFDKGNMKAKELWNLEGYRTEEVYSKIMPLLNNTVIYGVGNIHGAAEPLIQKFSTNKYGKKVG